MRAPDTLFREATGLIRLRVGRFGRIYPEIEILVRVCTAWPPYSEIRTYRTWRRPKRSDMEFSVYQFGGSIG